MSSEVKCELMVDDEDDKKGTFLLTLTCDGMLDRGMLFKSTASGSELSIPMTASEALSVANQISEQYMAYLDRIVAKDGDKVSGLKNDISAIVGQPDEKDGSDESD